MTPVVVNRAVRVRSARRRASNNLHSSQTSPTWMPPRVQNSSSSLAIIYHFTGSQVHVIGIPEMWSSAKFARPSLPFVRDFASCPLDRPGGEGLAARLGLEWPQHSYSLLMGSGATSDFVLSVDGVWSNLREFNSIC